ncbi:hypothetical protein IWW36_000797 [Coemansia brasiliensis]|uniref:SHSP domain-containing protein n=1 Tax=Coemansia brasiliensis TaxID=2650707 RepID=A0A9W8LZN5_9FUNG|nr:hypothetical protein IWW36_000797 [Coemansia brasiliensis]
MSMFSRFDKDLKHANGCLHEAADMFFHPIPEDIFHKWDHNHPPFPGPKLTKVRVECKGEEKKEEKKEEEVKVTVKVEEKKECSCAPPKNIRIYPCFEVIEAYDICESEWHPTMKDYTADKIWQLHVYLPGVAKDKVIVDILDKTLVVHGQGVFHTHCGMWPEHIEHCCDCTRKEPTCFCKKFALPDNCKVHESRVEFEKEVMVIRIQRG